MPDPITDEDISTSVDETDHSVVFGAVGPPVIPSDNTVPALPWSSAHFEPMTSDTQDINAVHRIDIADFIYNSLRVPRHLLYPSEPEVGGITRETIADALHEMSRVQFDGRASAMAEHTLIAPRYTADLANFYESRVLPAGDAANRVDLDHQQENTTQENQ